MIKKEQWLEDWKISEDCDSTSKSLIEVFDSFLSYLKNEKKLSQKTIKRHETSCHAIGGHIVNDLYNSFSPSGDKSKFGKKLLLYYITQYEGPLICHDNENWQNEIDATSRKLNKYINL